MRKNIENGISSHLNEIESTLPEVLIGDETLNYIYNKIKRLLEFNKIEIIQFNEDNEGISNNDFPIVRNHGFRYFIDESKKANGISGVPHLESSDQNTIRIFTPLNKKNKIISLLMVQRDKSIPFTKSDLSILKENIVPFFRKIESRIYLFKRLQQINNLSLKEDYDKLVQYIIETVVGLTGKQALLWEVSDVVEEEKRYLRIKKGITIVEKTATIFPKDARLSISARHSKNW